MILSTLRTVEINKNIVSKWRKYAVSFVPPLDNKSPMRYDIVKKIMVEELGIPVHSFLFNGVNIVTQTDIVLGPWALLIDGRNFQVALV